MRKKGEPRETYRVWLSKAGGVTFGCPRGEKCWPGRSSGSPEHGDQARRANPASPDRADEYFSPRLAGQKNRWWGWSWCGPIKRGDQALRSAPAYPDRAAEYFSPRIEGQKNRWWGWNWCGLIKRGDQALRSAPAYPYRKDEYFSQRIAGMEAGSLVKKKHSESSERQSGPNPRCLKKFDKMKKRVNVIFLVQLAVFRENKNEKTYRFARENQRG